MRNVISYPTNPVCQHVGCESDGTIQAGRPPRLRCRRCQRSFTEFDDLDGGHTTDGDGVPVRPTPPGDLYSAAELNRLNLLAVVPGGGLVPVEFR